MKATPVTPFIGAILGRASVARTADVERQLVGDYDGRLSRISEEDGYPAFEKTVGAQAAPVPGNDFGVHDVLALVVDDAAAKPKDARYRIVSGLFVLAAARGLQRDELRVVTLARDEIPEWQRIVSMAVERRISDEDDYYLQVQAHYAEVEASRPPKGKGSPK